MYFLSKDDNDDDDDDYPRYEYWYGYYMYSRTSRSSIRYYDSLPVLGGGLTVPGTRRTRGSKAAGFDLFVGAFQLSRVRARFSTTARTAKSFDFGGRLPAVGSCANRKSLNLQ